MNTDATPPSRIPWPPMIYGAAIVIGFVLDAFVPLPWIGSPMADLLLAFGIVLLIGVVAMDASAFMTLRRARTTVLPHRASDHLVTSGPFSFTRNPIYVANTMLVVGIGLIAGSLWLILLALVAAFLTQKLQIEGEERHLAERFGKRYRDYAKKVRRWI